MALNQITEVGFPSNVGGTLKEVDASTVVDNVFTFSSNSKKWQRVFDGGNSTYRASWLFIDGAPTDKASLVSIALANSAVKTLEIDAPIQIDGAIDAAGKTISVKSGGIISGSYTISNAVFEGNLTQQIITTEGTITSSKSATGKWHPTWFGAIGDGVADDYEAINFANTVAAANEQKIINFIPGEYNLGTNLSVSSGVILDFEYGAVVNGEVTISGSSAFFDAGLAQVVFGDDITIDGVYSISGNASPVNFGAIRGGVSDTTSAQQKMWDYVATLPDVYINIIYPSGIYYQSGTVLMPGDMGQQRFVSLTGYGVQIITDQDLPMWKRMPINMTESSAFIDSWVCVIKGFWFRGTSTVATPLPSQVGIQIGAIYSWRFEDIQLYRLYNGIEAYFSLQSVWYNVRSTQCSNSAILGRHGNWTGASVSNTSFNANTIEHCRFFNVSNAFCSLYFLGADQLKVKDIIVEGQKPQYGVYYDDSGNTGVLINTFEDMWFETTGGSVTNSTNFWIDGRSVLILKNIQRIYADYLFELTMNSASIVIIDGLPYTSAAPSDGLFKLNGTQSGSSIIFKNLRIEGATFVFDSVNWVGGVMPIEMMVEPIGISANGGYLQRFTPLMKSIAAQGHIFQSGVNSRVAAAFNTSTTLTSTNGQKLYISHTADGICATALKSGIATIYGESTTINGLDLVHSSTASTISSKIMLARSRGTTASPAVVNSTDLLGEYIAKGYDGASLLEGGKWQFLMDGTASSGILPTRIKLFLRNSSGVLTEVMGWRATGQMEMSVAPSSGALSDGLLSITSGGAVRQIATTDLIATGAANQLSYYAAANNKISPLTAITASRALKSDASGLPVAFDETTEPSLAELVFVKGVTSPIQSQFADTEKKASIARGVTAFSGDAVATVFTITHGLATTPTWAIAQAGSADAAAPFYVDISSIDATTFDVVFSTAPASGTDNVTLIWEVFDAGT